jgi:hypothetical protein
MNTDFEISIKKKTLGIPARKTAQILQRPRTSKPTDTDHSVSKVMHTVAAIPAMTLRPVRRLVFSSDNRGWRHFFIKFFKFSEKCFDKFSINFYIL